MTLVGCLRAVLCLLAVVPGSLRAQEAPAAPLSVRVGLYVSPPFVIERDGRHTGMAVELWEALAAALDLASDYRTYPTLRAVVDAADGGAIDVVVTNLTITRDRARRIDFTQPWFDAGLRIMVNQDQSAGFWDVVTGLRASGHLRAYAWLALVIVVATVLLTLFDRRFDRDFPRRWRDGLAESFHAVMSVATSGRTARKNLFGWAGRVWQALCGAGLRHLVGHQRDDHAGADQPDQRPGRPAGPPGRRLHRQRRRGARPHGRARGAPLSRPRRRGRRAAERPDRRAVADAPVLEYYAHTHPDIPLAVVGAIFEPDKYGFGLAHRSALTRPLTVELLGAHEGGLVDELRIRYFGEAS